MKVLLVASEVVPFAKTGGLADVAGALPAALEAAGVDISVCMPAYKCVKEAQIKTERLTDGISAGLIGTKSRIYFIEQDAFFDRDGLYQDKGGDYSDNLQRYSFFCRRVLTMIQELDLKIDIIHINDWQTSLIPVYLKSGLASVPSAGKIKTLLTIHNLGYQGLFPRESFPVLCLERKFLSLDGLEFYGKINLLKGGIIFSDFVTTVSPTYSKEIQSTEFGFGLDGVLRDRGDTITGILNGLDYSIWSPDTDTFIPRTYSLKSLRGKAENKRALQKQCNLPQDAGIPVLGIVSRLAQQKGLDIVLESLDRIIDMGAQVVVLGRGDTKYEAALKESEKKFPGSISVNLRFDDPLAHLIYSGSDMFLMPSAYEPCGLGQMISLKYGTIPVVFKTGGLADTVDDKTGFVLEKYSADDFVAAVTQAIGVYRKPQEWARLVANAMNCDFSWERAAAEYRSLYEDLARA